MLVLLPPSEGKTPARRGRPVDLDRLSFDALAPVRRRLLDALATTCRRDDALARLGVGASLGAEVERNTRLAGEPAQRVDRLYTGVLFAALDLASLPAPARRRADRDVVVLSGLWGALRLRDAVPAYRVPVCARLDGVGGLEALWRQHLAPVLADEAGDGPVLDCRSSSYVALWRPRGDSAERLVAVRVLKQGRVVSHDAKRTRGLVVRSLLARPGRTPRTVEALAAAVGEAFDVDLRPPPRLGAPWTLDVQAAPVPR